MRAATLMRQLLGLIAAGVATLAAVPAATAATVTVRAVSDATGAWIEAFYVAAPGELNDVVVSGAGDARLRITDSGAVITPTGRCTSIDAHSVLCRAPRSDPFLYHAQVELGDLDDRVATPKPTADVELSANGGPGNDTLTGADGGVLSGGAGDDRIYGGPCCSTLNGGDGNDEIHGSDDSYDDLDGGAGDDRLFGGDEVNYYNGLDDHGDAIRGGGGRDQIYGGRGNDWLTDGDRDGATTGQAPGPDTFDGGGGADTLSYRGRTQPVTVRAGGGGEAGEAGELDSVKSIENAVGGVGDDRLVGDLRANAFEGAGGDDVLDGGGGADELQGGRGDDRLRGGRDKDTLAGGPGLDELSCGTGRDLLKVVEGRRLREPVRGDCEHVEFTWDVASSMRLRSRPTRTRTWWLQLRAACPYVYDDAYVACRGTIVLRETGRRHRLLARGHFRRGDDGARFAVPLALTRLGYRRIARGVSATIVLRVTAPRTPARPFRWRMKAGAT